MPRVILSKFFQGHRFGVIVPGMPGLHGLVSIANETHPVHGEVVRISTGHALDRRPFAAHVVERREIDVWLPLPGAARRFRVHYTSAIWHPLDLDASKNGVALEHVLLLEPAVTVVDVPALECPEELQEWVSHPKPVARV